MTHEELTHFREVLVERSRNISEWMGSSPSLAYDDLLKVQGLLQQITEALSRINSGSFGECAVCHEGVELYRLEIQPVTEVCLGCITPQERAQLEDELYLASKIHRALLPQTITPIDGFEVAVKSLAARYVGGDYYDFLASSGGGISRVVIGDAMGKGLPAGLLMSNVQGALRILAQDIVSPAQLLTRLNSWLCRNVPITKFVSLACIGVGINPNGSTRLIYANGGHPAPILLRASGGMEELDSTGGILGVHEEFTYSESEVDLHPGDLIVMYTDGVVEAESNQGGMFGEEKLMRFLEGKRGSSLQELLDQLVVDVQEFTGKPEVDDDLTVIALRRT